MESPRTIFFSHITSIRTQNMSMSSVQHFRERVVQGKNKICKSSSSAVAATAAAAAEAVAAATTEAEAEEAENRSEYLRKKAESSIRILHVRARPNENKT